MTKEEKIKQILKSVQTINALANCIIIEYQVLLVDKPFTSPVLNQKAKRIKEYAEDIKKCYSQYARSLDQEFSDNEHALALWRLFDYFSLMETGQLNRYLDLVESSTETIEDTIKHI